MQHLCGIMAGFLLGMLILRLTKNNRKWRCEYDERQILTQGKGYRYAFYTEVILTFLYICLTEYEWFVPARTVVLFLIIFMGILVYAVYCIWNEAYFALNENWLKIQIVFLGIGLLNLFIGIRGVAAESWFVEESLNEAVLNLVMGISLVLIFAVLLIREKMMKYTE